MENVGFIPVDIRVRVDGLESEVSISVDEWGIAHINAEDKSSLFFGQGYNAARDRLWQIDLWRKRGLGRLAADFGPGYLAQDQAARLFLFRGDMDEEWLSYAPDTKEICEAFVSGINSYVALIERGQAALPVEFGLFGTRPEKWKAQDVVRIRSHALSRNALSEVIRANLFASGDISADALRKFLEPFTEPFVDSNLSLRDIPLAVLDVFKLASADVTFDPARLGASLVDAAKWSSVNALGDVVLNAEGQGSNNWVVAGSRTETGRPVLAFDPHRAYTLPSHRYVVHLSMPGFNAIGAGEPAIPGISMGHNGHSAFAITSWTVDQEDVFVYDTKPVADSDYKYRYADDWEAVIDVEELFDVKGYAAQSLKLQFTRHGPVLYRDEAKNLLFAIRTVWSEPGTAPYMGSLSTMRAKTFEEFKRGLKGWGAPSLNHIYTDVTGVIGWHTAGKVPVRTTWNGLLPVKGHGRHEWKGFVKLEDLPSSENPSKGFIATANEMNIPEDYLNALPPVGFEWIDRSRSERLHQVLASQERHTLKQSCQLQNDFRSMIAIRMIAILGKLEFQGDAANAASVLLSWDCQANGDSSPALLFEFWMTRHLRPALYQRFAPKVNASLLQPGDNQAALAVLENPLEWFPAEGEYERDGIISTSLSNAWSELVQRFGPDPKQWAWGDLHQLKLEHPASRAFPERAQQLNIDPIKLGGTGSTPMYSTYRSGDFGVMVGPAVRVVIDVGAWDNSLFVNVPGQSGDPNSPHFRDLTLSWMKGQYHQLAYTADAVRKVTRQHIVLVPASVS